MKQVEGQNGKFSNKGWWSWDLKFACEDGMGQHSKSPLEEREGCIVRKGAHAHGEHMQVGVVPFLEWVVHIQTWEKAC